MKLYGPDGRETMLISAIERKGDELILKGNVFGAMPLNISLRPDEARRAIGLFNFPTALFALSLPFRRGRMRLIKAGSHGEIPWRNLVHGWTLMVRGLQRR